MTVTAASFPTPHLAVRSTDSAELRRVSQFAVEQARVASATLPGLARELRTRCRADRITALVRAHQDFVQWRCELACRTTRRLGRGITYDATRFATSLGVGGPNYDRIGYLGRLRENPMWDPARRIYHGGRSTPAHTIMLRYGDLAAKRFATEAPHGDTLWNRVTLPDGTRVRGNRLVRGAAAGRVAADLKARLVRRGADPTRIETGGEPMYVVTADDRSRERMFQAAMTLLADAAPGDVTAWQTARYLLYQSPTTKKGSDAVTRTFLVTVGVILFDRPVMLEHDVDLRCIITGQRAATVMPRDPV